MAPVTANFVGGIAKRGGWHASGPAARLEFDRDQLVIRSKKFSKRLGLGDVSVRREACNAVRLSTGILAVRVSVIDRDGIEIEPYFTATRRGPVRRALQARGWPVIEDRWRFGRLGRASSK
jgi:hypothetical protein